MPTDGQRLLTGYIAQDAALVAAGRHPTSPAWLATLSRFWLSGRRRLVVRKGRQGGGSTTLARVAVATVLFGEHRDEHGARLGLPLISIRKAEATERLHNIVDTLTVMGVRHVRRDDVIELSGLPFYFPVLPCSSRLGTRGGTNVAALEDETASWWSDDLSANPAIEVDAALTPSLVTQPNARIYTISSPLGTSDFHAELMERGETADQCVASGPSWYWNPTIDEASTHGFQPVERLWKREFAAIPSEATTTIFGPADIDAAMAPRSDDTKITAEFPRIMAGDWSRGRDDRTWLVARWVDETTEKSEKLSDPPPNGEEWVWQVPPKVRTVMETDDDGITKPVRYLLRQTTRGGWFPFTSGASVPRRVLHVEDIGECAPELSTEEAVALIAKQAHRPRSRVWDSERVRTIALDQYEFGSLSVLLRQAGLSPVEQTWSSSSKRAAIDRLERLLRDRVIRLPANPKLRRQLGEYSEKITRSGSVAFGGSGRKDDYAQVLITLCMLMVNSRVMAGDPWMASNRRTEIPYA